MARHERFWCEFATHSRSSREPDPPAGWSVGSMHRSARLLFLSFPQSLSGNPLPPPLDARLEIAGMTDPELAVHW